LPLLRLLFEEGQAVGDVLHHAPARVGHLRRVVRRLDGDAGTAGQLRDPRVEGVQSLRGPLEICQHLADELRIHPIELGHGHASAEISAEISAHLTVARKAASPRGR
jgi:hypothetical protein